MEDKDIVDLYWDNVTVRLSRIRNNLKKFLEKEGYAL